MSARRSDAWAQQNLARSWEASKDLERDDLHSLDNYLIGWVAGLVPPEQWAAGLERARRNVDEAHARQQAKRS